uniref:Reverse transcriptase domain-containing protein n=1 Tax=Glossina palpalis gambiensis TaxID=67801 RepID=A0A1B0BXD6_9MUSC
MDSSIKKVRIRNRALMNLPPHILSFIQKKATAKNTGSGKIRYLKSKQIIKESINIHEQNYWKTFIGNIVMDNNVYRKIKGSAGVRKDYEISDIIGPQNTLVYDNIGKVNVLAEHFERIHNSNMSSTLSNYEDVVRYSVSLLSDRIPLTSFDTVNMDSERLRANHEFFTPSDIRSALKTRNNKKSAGPDGIPNFVFKKTTVSVWSHVTSLYNHCINIEYYPTSWKKAIVFPVLKPGDDPKLVQSYRPISLLSNVGKLFEYFLLLKIHQHLTENRIFKDFQFGFRPGHSTTHALIAFSNSVIERLNARSATIAVSLDIANAFDTAGQDGILRISGLVGNLFQSKGETKDNGEKDPEPML